MNCLETRAHRLGRNESLFREVNERIGQLDRTLARPGLETDSLWEFICECGDQACCEPVSLRSSEYEGIRARATSFLIVPGHDVAEIERVVERCERFEVVEKVDPDAAAVATARGPRTT